jgi:hypothetical protein
MEPSRDQIEIFVEGLFRHASPHGFVSLRAFHEDGSSKPFRITPTGLAGGLKFLMDAAEDDAYRAANDPKPIVFCPPLASFSDGKRAREQDIVEGFALSVECDRHPQQAKAKLEQILGPATFVVASGGKWTDTATGGIQDKLHLHWRLRTPARGADLAKLKQARNLAAELVGGDPSNKPVCHPIRWPGSWHRKAAPVLCQIKEQNPDREIDLTDALTALATATPTAQPKGNGKDDTAAASSWGEQIKHIISDGEGWHAAIASLAMKLLLGGMDDRAAGNMLRGLMENAPGPRDNRWLDRYNDIPRAVSTARAKVTTTTDQPLPEPIDLWAQFDPPDLPRDLLPAIIEDFARERADIMGADPSGLALAALAVCAAAIPDRITLQVKKRDAAWKESARLWVALIAPPSGKKSPIMSEAARPLKRLDASMFAIYLDQKAKYDELSKEEKKTATAPRQVRLRIEDTTIEAVQEVFKDSPDGVLCLQDELSGWFGAMDKYTSGRGAAKDRAFWLQAYNGGSYAVNRIGRGAALIHNNGISVLGGIQPALLRQIVDASIDDGLIQRLVPIVLRRGYESKDKEPGGAVELYASLIERLGSRTSSTPVPVHFADGAYAIRQRLEAKHLKLQSCESVNPKLAAHIGKYDGFFARLCLIWHCIEHVERDLIRPISENTARRVEQFLHSFLFPHALAFYSGLLGLADDHNRLTAVAGYILARELAAVTNRDIARGDRTMRGLTKAETSAVFEQLEALGWVTRTPGPRPGDPLHWNVNPKVHQKFTARAKREAEERQRDRDMIAAMFQQEQEARVS